MESFSSNAALRNALHCILLPYYATVGFLFALGIMMSSVVGTDSAERTEKLLRMFFWGNYSDMSEEVARDLAHRSQVIRNKGFNENLQFHFCNNHLLLAIFFCEPNHPFTPFKRIIIFFAISVYAYAASLLKSYWIPTISNELNSLVELLYDVVLVTIPSMLLDYLLQYGVIWYSHDIVADTLRQKSFQRRKEFLEKLIKENNLVVLDSVKSITSKMELGKMAGQTHAVKGRDDLFFICCVCLARVAEFFLRLILAIAFFLVAFYRAQMLFIELGERELISTVVVGATFQVSVAVLIIAFQYDRHDTYRNFLISLMLNVMVFSYINMYRSFRFRWITEHPSTSRSTLDGVVVKLQYVVDHVQCKKQKLCLDEPLIELHELYNSLGNRCPPKQGVTVASVFRVVDAYCTDKLERDEFRVSLKNIQRFISSREKKPEVVVSMQMLLKSKIAAMSSKYLTMITNTLGWKKDIRPGVAHTSVDRGKCSEKVVACLDAVEELEQRLVHGRLLYLLYDVKKNERGSPPPPTGSEKEEDPLVVPCSMSEALRRRIIRLTEDIDVAIPFLKHLVSSPSDTVTPIEVVQETLEICEKTRAEAVQMLAIVKQCPPNSSSLSFRSFQPLVEQLKLKKTLDAALETLHGVELEECHHVTKEEFLDRYFQSYCEAAGWAWIVTEKPKETSNPLEPA